MHLAGSSQIFGPLPPPTCVPEALGCLPGAPDKFYSLPPKTPHLHES